MKETTAFSKNIISGINYLMMEAHNHGNLKIARILKNCAKDICLSMENDVEPAETSFLVDSDLFAAINFLSKYASIKDESLKNEILVQIEGIQKSITVGGN